jgi:hypothetical protein
MKGFLSLWLLVQPMGDTRRSEEWLGHLLSTPSLLPGTNSAVTKFLNQKLQQLEKPLLCSTASTGFQK